MPSPPTTPCPAGIPPNPPSPPSRQPPGQRLVCGQPAGRAGQQVQPPPRCGGLCEWPLLLAVLEVKNPAEEKVTIWAAYNQRQTSSRYRSGPPAAPPHQSLVSNTVTSWEWLGSEDRRDYARGAMWGEQGAFCTNHSLYVVLRALTQLRDSEPALRYGCQHFRPVGDGITDQFGYSHYQQALLAFSRILNDRELVVVVEVANINTLSSKWKLLFSTADPGAGVPLPISPSAICTFASSHTCVVTLQPMQAQVLQRS
jgi:hypothetical protein